MCGVNVNVELRLVVKLGLMKRDDIFRHGGERPSLALSSETLLDEQFRVGRVLGAGGFGITYLAFDEVLGMVVAVKEYVPQHLAVDASNVYLTKDGRVVLLDFGAARVAVGERTKTLSVMVRHGYAPHEQCHSHGEQAAWTDVYATTATPSTLSKIAGRPWATRRTSHLAMPWPSSPACPEPSPLALPT